MEILIRCSLNSDNELNSCTVDMFSVSVHHKSGQHMHSVTQVAQEGGLGGTVQ